MSQTPQENPQDVLKPNQAQLNGAIGDSTRGDTYSNCEINQHHTEVYLQQSIQYAPVGIAILDRQMRYLAFSQRWLEEYNLTNEIIGCSVYEIFPNIPEQWKQIHQRCLVGAIEQGEETPYPQADGSIEWLRWSIRPWYQANDEIGGIMMFSENITAGKEAEITLGHNEERYSSLVSAISEVFWIVPSDGTVVDNPTWREFTGQTVEDVLAGRWLEVVHPEDRLAASKAWETAFKTGSAYRHEYRLRRHDGEYRHMQMQGIPLLEPDGSIREWVGICKDIHERKVAEVALSESNMLLRSILENTPDFIVVKDRQGSHVALNTNLANFIGKPIEEIVGKNDAQLFPPEDARQIIAKDQQIRTSGISETYEEEVSNGESRETYFTTKAPWRDADGQIIGIIAVTRNISDRKQAELQLKQSEERYRYLISATSQLFWIAPPDGIVTQDNLAWREYTGQTWEEYKGWGWLETIHPEDRLLMAQSWEAAVKTCTPFQHEFRWRRHDGEYRYTLSRGVPTLEADGSIREWIGTCSDIHERKQVELALQQSEERFRSLIEATSQIVWSANCEGAFVGDQEQWRAFTGQTLEEIQGWGWLNMVHPEDRIQTNQAWSAAVANRSTYEAETRIRRYDGEYRYLNVRGVPILNADGGIREWVGANIDITERKLAELALRQNLEILDSASNSIIIRDMDDRITYWNRGAELLYGWKKEEVIGQYIHTFLQTDFPKPRETILSEFLEQGHWEGELQHTTRHGRQVIVASRWTLQRDTKGQPYTQLEINNDITERKQAELALAQAKQAAEAANRTKSEFLANMNHELRTPLNGILGYAQILQRDPATTSKQQKGLSVIHQCGSHLLTLINDILDLSKLEVQKMDLYPQDFHFANFLTTTVEICRIKAEQKGIAFHYHPINLPTAVHADDKRLRQVLLNLLSNAVKFTDFGSVTFQVEAVGSQQIIQTSSTRIRFQVEDTGIGIPKEKLQSIFLPFEQAGKRERNSEGTGLGLAISQQIVQMMGSSIQVNSIPGKCSTFWFEVDVPAADWLAQAITINQKVIGYQGERRKILVIDDRQENRAVAIGMLAPLGFKLAQADDGQVGLDLALQMRPDLIITDVMMSKMNGLEMTRRLRQLPDFAKTPIIASPASLSQVDMQEALEAGCSSFFPKPIEFSGLLGELQRHLGLQWIYETTSEVAEVSAEVLSSVDLVMPSSHELATVYKAAQDGFMSDIQQEANRLKQLNPQYAPLANKLLELSQKFDDEAILNLLAPYI